MEYREIVSVTGLGGLYQLLSTKSDGAIVRNLADNTTKFISARLHNVTPLESIEIYTTSNNVRLHEVLEQMKSKETAKPDTKKASNDEIKSYFKEVYPDMDEDRVYVSDMKKMLKWFDLLNTNNLLDFTAMKQQQEAAANEAPAEGEAQVAEHKKAATTEEVALVEDAEKPAKKARAKKATAGEEGAEGEEKPTKKKAAKKATATEEGAEGEEKPAKKAAAKKKKED